MGQSSLMIVPSRIDRTLLLILYHSGVDHGRGDQTDSWRDWRRA